MKKNLSKKLTVSRKKIKSRWETYQRHKKKIQKKKITKEKKQQQIEKLHSETKTKVSKVWGDYGQKRYEATHKSKYTGLRILNREKIKTGVVENYKLVNLKGLQRLSQHKDIRYLLVVLKIYLPETDTYTYASDSFTPLSMKGLTGKEITDLVLEKFRALVRYEGFQVKSTTIKIIYEGSKKSEKN